jgi:hypothetical protein
MTDLTRSALLACVVLAAGVPCWAGDDTLPAQKLAAAHVPVEHLPEPLRTRVADLIAGPALFSRGPVETFPCRPAVYVWLLDNPQWNFHAWRAKGVKCATVERQDDGLFVGTDPQGNEFRWLLIHSRPGLRVWYGEGEGRPLPLMPAVSLRAVVLLRYQEVKAPDGQVGIRHRAEVFAQFDGKTAALVAKLCGMTIEGAGKKAAEQVGLFFSGMAWYLSENPDWAVRHLRPAGGPRSAELRQLDAILFPTAADPS